MPGHHAIILTDASVAFFPGCVFCAFAKTKCHSLTRNNTSEDNSIVLGQCIFVLFESFFRFWTLFPIAAFDSFYYVL